jgi:hypothetical protein
MVVRKSTRMTISVMARIKILQRGRPWAFSKPLHHLLTDARQFDILHC